MCEVLGQPGTHTEILPTIHFYLTVFNYGCLYRYVHGRARTPEVSDAPGDGVAGNWEPPDMGAGT